MVELAGQMNYFQMVGWLDGWMVGRLDCWIIILDRYIDIDIAEWCHGDGIA